MATDYYEILGLSRFADEELIEKAYRILARRYHPDRAQEQESDAERFHLVQQAYEVLSSPPKRTLYDQGLLNPPRGNGRSIGRDIYQVLTLRFEQAVRGGKVTVHRIAPVGPRHLEVIVPRGITDGERLRIAGQGLPANGGPQGDLILIVCVTPHPRLRRDGLDLYLEAPVPIDVAMLGGSITVTTLDGEMEVQVPPGTSGGDRLRIRAGGIRNSRGQHGDLYVLPQIQIAREVSRQAQEHAEHESQAAAERAALEAAKIEVAHQQRALDQGRQELEAERRKLHEQDDALRRHELNIATARDELHRRTAELDEQAALLKERRQALEADQRRLEHEARSAAERETTLGSTSTQLDQRAADFDARAAQLKQREAELREAGTRLEADRAAFIAEQTASQAKATEAAEALDRQRRELDALNDQLARRTAELTEQSAALHADREALNTAQAKLQPDRVQLADRTSATAALEHRLKQQEATLTTRADELDKGRGELDARIADNERRTTELARRSDELDARESELAGLSQQLQKQREAMEAQAAALAADRTDLDQQRRELKEARDAVSLDQQRLADDRKTLDGARADLESAQRQLADEAKACVRRAAELDEAERASSALSQQLNEEREALGKVRADAEAQLVRAVALERSLEHRAAELDTATRELEQQRAVLDAQQRQEVDRLAKSQSSATDALHQRQFALDQRESALQQQAAGLDRQRLDLEAFRASVPEQERALMEQREALSRRAAELDGRTSEIDQRETVQRKAADELARKQRELESRAADLLQREQAASTILQKTTQDADRLARREAELAQEHDAARKLRSDIEAQKRELDGKSQHLAAQERALIARQEEVSREAAKLKQATAAAEMKRGELEALEHRLRDEQAKLTEATAGVQRQRKAVVELERELAARAAKLDEQAAALAEQAKAAKEQPTVPPMPVVETPAPVLVHSIVARPPRFTFARRGNRPALDLAPHHLRTAAGYIDNAGGRHLFVDVVDAAQKQTNTWAAAIRYYHANRGGAWKWAHTPADKSSAPGIDGHQSIGAASPALIVAGGKVLLFYAARSAAAPGRAPGPGPAPGRPPNVLAGRDEPDHLSSCIMVAAADADADGAPSGAFKPLATALQPGTTWDSLRLDHPTVIVDGDTLHLFYTGYDDPRNLSRRCLGHATARIGDHPFRRDARPILTVPGGGEMGRVFRHAGYFHLLYRHFDGGQWHHYTSRDLSHWRPSAPSAAALLDSATDPQDLMIFTDPCSNLPATPEALITAPERGVIKLWPYRVSIESIPSESPEPAA